MGRPPDAQARKRWTAKQLLAVATREGLYTKQNGSHVLVHLNGRVLTIINMHARQHLDDQTRAFRRAGLIP